MTTSETHEEAEQSAQNDLTLKRPRRWLAILLSIVSPGLGHTYSGELVRAFVIVTGIAFVIQPVLALYGRTASLAAFLVVVAAGLAIYVLVALDAARVARRPRRRLFTRRAVFLACIGFLAVSVSIDVAGEWFRENWIASPYRVASGAMTPTLLIGDHIYIDPRAYATGKPARGDLVVFSIARDDRGVRPRDRNPKLPVDAFIKRIVGLPGDTIDFDGASLFVNGEPKTGTRSEEAIPGPRGGTLLLLPENVGSANYTVAVDSSFSDRSTKHFAVEPHRYFMAGDNRDYSNDSRYWGTIHRNDIVGRVTRIYWSWDFNGSPALLLNPSTFWSLLQESTRWERIGREVE